MIDIDKHLGNGIKIKLGDDDVMLPQLGIEYQRQKFKVINAFGSQFDESEIKELKSMKNKSQSEIDEELEAKTFKRIMEALSGDVIDAGKDIVKETVNRLFPECKDENKKSLFASKYFLQILMAQIGEVDNSKSHEEIKKADTLERIKELQNNKSA